MLHKYNTGKQNKLRIKETGNTKNVLGCCEENVILPVSKNNQ